VRTIAVFSVKGGVGKTSAAVNLAFSASLGHRTVLWDLDPQGSASFVLQADPRSKGSARSVVRGRSELSGLLRGTEEKRLSVVPAHGSFRALDLELDSVKAPRDRLRRALGSVGGKVEVVVLDCPPGMSLVSEAVLTAADVIVVPVVPGALSTRSLDQVVELVASMRRRKPRVVAFLSMVDRRKAIHREAVDRLAAGAPPMVPVVVPYSTTVERMGTERAPIGTFAPRSLAAGAYEELWAAVASAARL